MGSTSIRVIEQVFLARFIFGSVSVKMAQLLGCLRFSSFLGTGGILLLSGLSFT
jgi:hypothetical protein